MEDILESDLIPIATFLFGLAASFGYLVGKERNDNRGKVWRLLLVVVGFQLASVVICAYSLNTGNIFFASFSLSGGRIGLLIRCLAFSTGFCSGLAATHQGGFRWAGYAGVLGMLLAYGALLALTLKESISKVLPDPNASVTSGVIATEASQGVTVEEFELTFSPSALAARSDGSVFVAGYAGGYLQAGVVFRVDWLGSGPSATEVARGLTRPHGLALVNEDLYVSRAGQYAHARNGQLIQEPTGAVTRLQDLDKNGVFDYYHDIVTGLPGAQFPDGLHQNNGLAVSPSGELFITVGTSTDHGPPVAQYEGTILRCDLKGNGLMEFARGVRNPFGISFGPLGKLFCTDNDPNFADLGDKLCVVEEGAHLGFPYDSFDGLEVEGITAPIKRFSSAQGLSYVPDDEPFKWNGCLIMASYGDDAVSAIRISKKQDGSLAATSEFIARVNDVVDVAYAGSGVVFACSYADRKLFRIQLPE